MIISRDFEETIFEFDMRNIQIEQELVCEVLKERYSVIKGINETKDSIVDKVSEIISKIFDGISDLLEKAIMNLRKAFQGINFRKAKDRIEQIRKSTNDPKGIEFEMLIPKVKLMNSSDIDKLTPENIIGLHVDGNQWSLKNPTNNTRGSYEKSASKAFGQMSSLVFFKDTKFNFNEFKQNGDSKFKEVIQEVETISINKSNCQSQKGKLEQQLETVGKFIEGDFDKCIDKLSKLKTESRKIAVKSRTMTFTNNDPLSISGKLGVPDKSLKNQFIDAANCYQQTVRYTVQGLFQSTAFHIQCLNKNVNNFSRALL